LGPVITQSTTHASLLARLTQGSDRGAWAEFFDRYAELIRGFARRKNLQPAECDDVLQDVLIGLTKAMPDFTYDPARGKFRSYLKTAVIHAIYQRTRQKPGGIALGDIESQVVADESDATVEESWEAEWRQYHLRLAMKTIAAEFSRTDREAFERYALRGEEALRTAEDLHVSIDQVYQAKSRILRRLSELIDQQVQEEG